MKLVEVTGPSLINSGNDVTVYPMLTYLGSEGIKKSHQVGESERDVGTVQGAKDTLYGFPFP